MNNVLTLFSALLLVTFSSVLIAEEKIIMIESTITGSQEQPKVISIVPWKPATDPEYIGEEVQGLGESVNIFQSLDRANFNRERLYIGSTRKIRYGTKSTD